MKVLITGGTHGMGRGVARTLAKIRTEKNEIIILCRSEYLGLKTVEELKTGNPDITASMVLCDLSDMRSVRDAAATIQGQHNYLDAIFINAGIGYAPRRIETVDGMDQHFQVNYLAQFHLVIQLLGLLEKSARGGRVIFNATSGGRVFWDDMQLSKHWHYEKAIRQAMVAKRMLVRTLHELYKEKDKKVSFMGFSISQTVWTNQITIIPRHMRIMATVMKAFGLFISEEQCGEIMSPLFMENPVKINVQSGCLYTNSKAGFTMILEDDEVQSVEKRNALLEYSLKLCGNDSVWSTAYNVFS